MKAKKLQKYKCLFCEKIITDDKGSHGVWKGDALMDHINNNHSGDIIDEWFDEHLKEMTLGDDE